jgi:hypothetical protein
MNWFMRIWNRWRYRPTLQDFWGPEDGQKIVGLIQFQDMIVVASEYRVYVMTRGHKALWDLEIQQIANQTRR